ncbi:septal ring lytic transglycosylase RlpA family protein [Thiocystis violacea]|uniref:septal ring lytic transglycosylase RlpA family protein n=1 Tax=Thiocystis violacea TaxID=13725 RepID=UPI001F5B99FA|nr:septal ring lytic transglycosylase RlpA family protein [Thiocystis violacea]MBK1720188.1 septal ring lytic transglycosylase RlpA family lipoprotein [Thiocystis violacea]
MTQAQAIVSDGVASYYGDGFNGRRTASGERFDMHDLTAAHRTLEFGTRVMVTNKANGRSVEVTINDRGPYAHGRSIDVSKGAAKELGMLGSGVARVELKVVDSDSSAAPIANELDVAQAQRVLMDLF